MLWEGSKDVDDEEGVENSEGEVNLVESVLHTLLGFVLDSLKNFSYGSRGTALELLVVRRIVGCHVVSCML